MIAVPIVIVIVLLLLLVIRTVDTGEVVVVTRFGEVVGMESEGLHTKSPFDEYHTILVTQQQIEETYFTATKDIQSIDQMIVTQFTIDATKASTLYQKFKGQHVDSIIKPVLYDGFKSATAAYTLEDAIAKRDELADRMYENTKDKLAPYGINIISVEIKEVTIPAEYAAAVEQRKIAEQTRLKAETEKQTAIINAEKEFEVKKLEAEANAVVTESLTPEILQKQYLDKWDGKLPTYMGGGSDPLTLMIPATTSGAVSAESIQRSE
jgi:regulator of protease activity HflC (stomatin/prohibitin superfamily)